MVPFWIALLSYVLLPCVVTGKIFFEENFDDTTWTERWIRSDRQEINGKPYGYFNWTAGKWSYDENDRGIRTMDDNSHYAISTKFPRFSNRNRTLVVQFTVKFERIADLGDENHCAAAFIKLFPSSHNPKRMDENSKYLMKFGPDTCSSAHRIESTIYYRGKNWAFNRRLDYDRNVYIYLPYPFLPDDPHTHLYTFALFPNNTFEKRVDGRLIKEESGHMEQLWQTHPERRLKADPDAVRPDNWDEREFILDPTEQKPADWDQPELIPDPYSSQPDDWDTEADGPWEHPLISNPAFRGAWMATQLIPNPAYQGKWSAAMIDNPAYVPDPDMYLVKDIGAIGIEGWQEQAGTVFDNILVTDDLEGALEKGLPVQKKAFEAESRLFEERCERERLRRVADVERIAKDKKKMRQLVKNHQKNHQEL